MKKLRDYQNELLDEILKELPNHQKICVQLSTGGGKTVIFTELIKQLNSKTLILVDSIDLLNQTVDTFDKMGLDIGSLTAGSKMPKNQVVVAMVSTLNNRVKKNTNLLNEIQYCIVDECHVWIFNKIFPYLQNAKIIGFTATPVRLKRYKIDEDYTAVETMSDVYDYIICGKPIKWLIENNYLVKDNNELIDFDYSGLKTDASGEFTAKSLKEVFQKIEYQKALRKSYETFAEGKKTMIFTSSTETNAIFAELFKDKNIRTYDSVNNKPNERDDIIEWFKNTNDAILINTGCFTKGFDVCDVECIIVARATKSLALWIQICGRGARITTKIEKPEILIIDGGNNIAEHGIFSFERDWKKIFSDRKIKAIIEPMQECISCGYTFPEVDKECPNCGEKVEPKEKIENTQEKLFSINGQKAKLKPPIIDINYFINKGSTDYEALKVLREKWVNFLVKSEIKQQSFDYHIKKGTFNQKFNVLLKPYYLKIITSILKKGKNVVYKSYCQKILETAYTKKYGND
jgi:superfamily II DNA or RNA helicase